jgi:hypothetical protein
MGLLDLIRGTQNSKRTGNATAIHATGDEQSEDSVAKIAITSGEQHKNLPSIAPTGSPSGSDRYCWPHSSAMNSMELTRMVSRIDLFCAKGLNEHSAEELAEKLVSRDRELDDRRVCYECSHLKGMVRVRCNNWKAAGNVTDSNSAFLDYDFCSILRRCSGFTAYS